MRWSGRFYVSVALAVAGCATPPGPGAASDASPSHVAAPAFAPSGVGAYFGESHPRLLSCWERDLLSAAAVANSSRVVEVRATLKPTSDVHCADLSVVRTSHRVRGSGVLLADGFIVTGEHVVRNADSITVTFSDASVRVVDAVAVPDELDLAVLRVAGAPPTVLTPWPEGSPARGDAVVALSGGRGSGAGRFRFGVVTVRTVSLQDRIDPTGARRYDRLIETTVPLEPGYSGGPLIDTGGRLMGLNVAVAGDPRSANCRGYAVPFDAETRRAIAEVAAAIAADGSTGQASRPGPDARGPGVATRVIRSVARSTGAVGRP